MYLSSETWCGKYESCARCHWQLPSVWWRGCQSRTQPPTSSSPKIWSASAFSWGSLSPSYTWRNDNEDFLLHIKWSMHSYLEVCLGCLVPVLVHPAAKSLGQYRGSGLKRVSNTPCPCRPPAASSTMGTMWPLSSKETLVPALSNEMVIPLLGGAEGNSSCFSTNELDLSGIPGCPDWMMTPRSLSMFVWAAFDPGLFNNPSISNELSGSSTFTMLWKTVDNSERWR